MIACNAVLDMPVLIGRTQSGESGAASFIAKQMRELTMTRLEAFYPEIISLVSEAGETQDSEMASVRYETAQAALHFALLLPRSFPIPEVAADPDGEISFDWSRSGKMFSVSISAEGKISYAGRFSDKSKIHGTEQLSEAIPSEILRGIEKTIR
jgi:hypothetical protein